MTVRAYAYERWPRVPRGELLELRRALRALPSLWGSRAAGGALLRESETVLGAACALEPLVPELVSVEHARASLTTSGLVLQLEPATAPSATILVELPCELAAGLVDRVLGGDGQPAHPFDRGLDALSRGVLAYLVARLLAHTYLRLRAVLVDPARIAPLLGSDRVLCWPLAVQLGSRTHGGLRALVPTASLRALPEARGDAWTDPFGDFAELEVTLCAHAASCQLTRAQIGALAAGDVVVPERCNLVHDRHGFSGELTLHVLRAPGTGFTARASGDELVLQASLTEGEGTVTEGKRIATQKIEVDPEAPSLAETPIELCLELARFTMTLRELRALRPGGVLSTGRLVGERALLSAAGRPIARGELVDIDGEVGLRVLELLGAK